MQKKLHALSAESESLDSERDQRRELQERIEAEARVVTKVRVCLATSREVRLVMFNGCHLVCVLQEKQSAEEVNTEARRKLKDYRVPDVSQ